MSFFVYILSLERRVLSYSCELFSYWWCFSSEGSYE